MSISQNLRVISWRAANRAVIAAVEKAQELNIKINVAVTDSGGNLSAFLRMPEAFLHSIDIAKDKSLTAAGFGVATDELYKMIEGSASLRSGIIARPNCVVFGGGLPIFDGDSLIAGIGVSGGSEQEDGLCAQAGLDAILAM